MALLKRILLFCLSVVFSVFLLIGATSSYSKEQISAEDILKDFIELRSDINQEVIYYMHTRLDSRLSYEDEFINNISLANFKSTENERLNYKVINKVKKNTYFIETEWPWLWGDSRYGYFVVNINNGYLTLIDNYITESISPPINSYKIDRDKIVMKIDDKNISLLI